MSETMIASWSTLWLGDLPCRYGRAPELGRDHGELGALLVANHGGFRLQLTAIIPDGFSIARRDFQDLAPDQLFADPRFAERYRELRAELAPRLPRRESIGVALINGARRHEIATDEEPFSGSTGGRGVAQHHETWDLPWPDDPLADTWLAVRIDDTTFAIELPYGVCRDESRPLALTAPPPSAPPAGATRRWCKLELESELLGSTRVRLRARGDEPGVLEVELYRESHADWTAPALELTVAPVPPAAGRARRARRIEDWRSPDFMRRAARFAVEPLAPGRHYAEVTVRFASFWRGSRGPAYHVVLPSSLLGR